MESTAKEEPEPESYIAIKSKADIAAEAPESIAPEPAATSPKPSSQTTAPPLGPEEMANDMDTLSDMEAPAPSQEKEPVVMERIPYAAELPEAEADISENIPSSTDITPLQPVNDEAPDESLAEISPDLEEETSEAISEEPDETDDKGAKQPETPAPSIEPDIAEEVFTPADIPEDNETEALEEALQDIIRSTLPKPQKETSDIEPEAKIAVVEPDAKSEEIASTEILSPWQAYAAAFNYADDRPRIAIVISEAGISPSRTREAIEKLPAAVTLGFNPYGTNLQELVDQARGEGHEVLLQLPMEPVGYPKIDPGPQAMMTDLTEDENRARLDWALNRFTGYAGVTNQMGSKFTAVTDSIQPILVVLKEKGFFYLDSRTASNSVAAEIADDLDIPVAINNRFLDHKADGALIDARLTELESIAQRTGSAIGIAYPHSETFRHLSSWADTLDQKGLVLAPVSALIER